MKLNLEFYKENLNSENESEHSLVNFINENEESVYGNFIYDKEDLNKFITFSEFRKNIISWYPFKNNCSILEVCGNLGELTGELCNYSKRVVSIENSKLKAEANSKRNQKRENLEIIVGNIKDIKLNEKFDYIILIGCLEYLYKEFGEGVFEGAHFEYFKKYLKDDGIILFASDNKFGMRSWSVFNKNDNCLKTESVNKHKNKSQSQLLSKKQLEESIKKSGFSNYKFYYPLPDYKIPNVIFTDLFLPNSNNIHRNLSFFYENEVVNFHENGGFSEILNEDSKLFGFFANSFLIEIGNSNFSNIKYVSFWNNRDKKYRLKTVMYDNEVHKNADNEISVFHIEQMKKNIDILNKQKIKTLDSYIDETIVSRIVENEKTLDTFIVQALKEGKIEEALKYINLFYENVLKKLEIKDCDNNIFIKQGIKVDPDLIKELHFTKQGLWDLNFQNTFLINNDFWVYDQEWILEDIPIEFILYRGLVISEEIQKLVEQDFLLKKLNLLKYKAVFDELEKNIANNILDEKLNELFYRPVENVRGLLVENALLKDKILKLEKEISSKDEVIKNVTHSKSWKVTKPLRDINDLLKNK